MLAMCLVRRDAASFNGPSLMRMGSRHGLRNSMKQRLLRKNRGRWKGPEGKQPTKLELVEVTICFDCGESLHLTLD